MSKESNTPGQIYKMVASLVDHRDVTLIEGVQDIAKYQIKYNWSNQKHLGPGFSIIMGSYCYSTPNDMSLLFDVHGPYTAVEIWFVGEDEPRAYYPVRKLKKKIKKYLRMMEREYGD